MATSPASAAEVVQATGVRFEGDRLVVSLSDSREVSVPISKVGWLDWLAGASPEQRAHWSVEPDGFEIGHLLALQPLA